MNKKHNVSILYINNPKFHFGTDGFLLKNGDCYVGDFCAHNNGIVWREGPGIYITKDEHSYQGLWDNDNLNGADMVIRYPSGAEYQGSLKRGKYSGLGNLILDNKLQLQCNFHKNIPFGEVIMKDQNNKIWKGTFKEDHAILTPENPFFANLSYDIGKEIQEYFIDDNHFPIM